MIGVVAVAVAAATPVCVLAGSPDETPRLAAWSTAAAAAGPAVETVDPPCRGPADALDLTDWKVTLPIGDPGRAKPTPLEVTQPELADYATAPWFTSTPACDGVVFRAPVDGVTTSGSRNPRSELREMTDRGATNASWSSTAGIHTMVVTEAFTHLPDVKPALVGAQIHDADDDISVIRLEGNKLYITDGDDSHHKLVTDTYDLGTKFEARFEVGNGKVAVYYNGVLQTTIVRSFTNAYFKAGAYTQANCGDSAPCDNSNYGETTIYGLSVTHDPDPAALPAARPAAPDAPENEFPLYLGIGSAAVVIVAAGLGYLLRRRHGRRR